MEPIYTSTACIQEEQERKEGAVETETGQRISLKETQTSMKNSLVVACASGSSKTSASSITTSTKGRTTTPRCLFEVGIAQAKTMNPSQTKTPRNDRLSLESDSEDSIEDEEKEESTNVDGETAHTAEDNRTNNNAIITLDVEEDGASGMSLSTDKNGNPLFPMKGTAKPHWKFVRLVAKKGVDVATVCSTDATHAFCLLCRNNITFSRGNGNSVFRHVNRKHKRNLDALYETDKGSAGSVTKRQKGLSTYFSTMVKEQNMKKLPIPDQLHGECLLVQWVSRSLRPFSIVEDESFKEYSSFLCQARGMFVVPSRIKVRRQMMELGNYVMQLIRKDMKHSMLYFGLTTDIWSSRMMQSFMALTIHYLTNDFEMKNAVLEVKPLVGSHTGKHFCIAIIFCCMMLFSRLLLFVFGIGKWMFDVAVLIIPFSPPRMFKLIVAVTHSAVTSFMFVL
jgi:hypothetical protein